MLSTCHPPSCRTLSVSDTPSARPWPAPAGHRTCDMAEEVLEVGCQLSIAAVPDAAIQDVLQGHEEAEHITLMPPEQPVAGLRDRDAPQLCFAVPACCST